MTTPGWVFRITHTCLEELEKGTQDMGLKHIPRFQSQLSYLGDVPTPWEMITLPIN